MMGSFQASYFQILYLLISALLECKAQTARTCKVHQLNINYVQGDNMSISCLTTTHPLESLTVKLSRTNPLQHILKYSDNSSALEHQRWSVRNDAGNVTLDLKDISLSDDGIYDCQVYNDWDCKATQFILRVKECKTLNAVHATPNTSVLLQCSEHPQQKRTDQAIWTVVVGHQSVDISKHRPPHKPSNSTERVPKPLYERAKTLGNGSLLIRDAVNSDELWYRCRVSEKTCYEVKLVMKGDGTSHSTTKLETLSTTYHTADSPVVQTEGNIDASAEVTTNLTAVVMTAIVSLCVLISLIMCVIFYFKKRRRKIINQKASNCRFSAYYSQIAEGFDVPLYSLVERSTETMITFAQEDPACIVHHNMYEI